MIYTTYPEKLQECSVFFQDPGRAGAAVPAGVQHNDRGFPERMTPDIRNNRDNFLRFNQTKFERFQQLVPNLNMRRILNSLPFLLSINSPKLVGFVEGECALGVVNPYFDDDTRRFITGKFPGVNADIQPGDMFVQMIAVIGSVGTIAYNKKSDFDYWICVDPSEVTPEKYERFRKKVVLIQKWMEAETGVSIHLFVNDVRNLRRNIFDEDEDEAFGSVMGGLLKDEFFRSSIITSGKVPFWWVVPVTAKDSDYAALWQTLSDDERRNYFVDIGNLYRISREDFLGAALFQMVKSLGNPFKSILKLGVLNKYLFDRQDAPLISQKIKHFVQQGSITNTILDSYLMMFREVFEYYSKSGAEASFLRVLQMNLYLKISPQLTKYAAMKTRSGMPYRVEEMFRYVKQWQWDMKTIRELDNFDNWDFNRVMKFWDQVQRFMLVSYQKISTEFPNIDIRKRISESDFKLLQRKIRSHYLRSDDKIEQFITFKETASESLLTIEPVVEGIRSVGWRLYKKVVYEAGTSDTILIRTEPSLIGLAAWTVINRIYDPRYSRINIDTGYQRVSKNISVDFMNSLAEFFTEERMKQKNKYILKEVFSTLNFIVFDFNLEPSDTIRTIHHIWHTSWGESFIREYPADSGIGSVLVTLARDGVVMKKPFDEYCGFSAPDPHRKSYRDAIQLCRDSYNAIVLGGGTIPLRFVSRAGSNYILIMNSGKEVNAELHPNIMRLYATITMKPDTAARYSFYNSRESGLASLETAYAAAVPRTISIVYELKGEFIFAYVINECGNLFVFIRHKSMEDVFLAQLYVFSKNVLERVRSINRFTPLEVDKINIRQIQSDRLGNLSLADRTDQVKNLYLGKYARNAAYMVIINRSMGSEPLFSARFPDGIESGFMAGSEMYAIADKITAMRAGGSKIANLLCDLDYTDSAGNRDITTSVFFADRYQVEMNVEKFLKANPA